MVNHLSPDSKEFQDYLQNPENSAYRKLFLNWDKFWPQNRPTATDFNIIYKRKDRAPYQEISFDDGKTEKIWNTFGKKQVNLDVSQPITKEFIREQITRLIKHGVKIVLLDVFAYAIKKLNTSDFFIEPEIWQLLEKISQMAESAGASVLPEIHEHYSYNQKLTQKGCFSYYFVLPIVVLYELYYHQADELAAWLNQASMRQFTTLDTHDGIGIVDGKGILGDQQLDYTVNRLYKVGANVKRAYSSSEYHNIDIYQLNITFYSAVGNSDNAYLLARAIQLFAPGIPQVYYVGLLAGSNDVNLVEKTKEGRDINRHYYSLTAAKQTLNQPVVRQLLKLLQYRNKSAAFDLKGTIKTQIKEKHQLEVIRTDQSGQLKGILKTNLLDYHFSISETDGDLTKHILAVGED